MKECHYCSKRVSEKTTRMRVGVDGRERRACSDCNVKLDDRDKRMLELRDTFSVEKDVRRRRGPHRITNGQYDELFDSQRGMCAICGKFSYALHVDHDHSCDCPGNGGCPKCIRGLLCSGCNTSLGGLGDSLDGVLRAVRYLESPRPLATLDDEQ